MSNAHAGRRAGGAENDQVGRHTATWRMVGPVIADQVDRLAAEATISSAACSSFSRGLRGSVQLADFVDLGVTAQALGMPIVDEDVVRSRACRGPYDGVLV